MLKNIQSRILPLSQTPYKTLVLYGTMFFLGFILGTILTIENPQFFQSNILSTPNVHTVIETPCSSLPNSLFPQAIAIEWHTIHQSCFASVTSIYLGDVLQETWHLVEKSQGTYLIHDIHIQQSRYAE